MRGIGWKLIVAAPVAERRGLFAACCVPLQFFSVDQIEDAEEIADLQQDRGHNRSDEGG
jgi:hypothetical protein